MSETTQQQLSTMLVLSNEVEDFNLLSKALSNYFPHHRLNHIFLNTKYYTANVQLIRKQWPHSNQITKSESANVQKQESNSHTNNKYDMVIMLMNQNQSFSAQIYDYVINLYNPQNYILIVNTVNKQMNWPQSDKITNEVNNFIQIIKQNLNELIIHPPERTKKGLLNQDYEDGNIFNLLELIQTTPWSHILRVQNNKKQTNIQTSNETKTQMVAIEQKQLKLQLSEPIQNQQEMTDEQLEEEMQNFEKLMFQMKNLRNMTPEASQQGAPDRKKMAQNLIGKLMGFM